MSDKIRKYVLPNLPYLFVFWFFSKIGTAYRIAPGTDFWTKLMGMLDTFPKAFETYWPGLGGIDLLVGLAGAAGVYLLIQSKIRQAKKFRRDAEYGTARFGTKEDIKPFVDPKFQNNVILTGTEFLTMNTRPKIPANARNLNACVIGSSGSGKTRFWLTPQLLQAHSSYVVVDPKGGTLDQCGRFLQREKYRVRVFNSIDFSKSMHYNPLAYIKTESDVLKFVTALIANTKGDGKEGDEFWTKAETLLYCALVAYIVFEGPEEERNMNTLVEMINSMEVREDDETFKNAVDYMFDGLERRSPQHFAVRQYKKYKLASGKTAKSILISCGARLAPFDIPQLREIMSYDELELDKLGDEKSALFFLISDTDTTYNFLVALAFSQMFNLLCERADNTYGGRLPYHVRVLWDEAANTGQVPGLEKIVAVIRSREISLTLFYQAMSQCKALYKDHSETIMGNMDSMNGFQVLQKIREKNNVPVLMLTAKSDEEDKVSGLRLGADDYLTKPFGINELMARVNSLIRRYTTLNPVTGNEAATMLLKDMVIDKINRTVTVQNLPVDLTGKEFDLLLFLASNKGRVFTKKQLYTQVWTEEYDFDDNIGGLPPCLFLSFFTVPMICTS